MKRIKYEFLKWQKLKIKVTKSERRNQILWQFFADELLVMFLTFVRKNCWNTQEFKHKLNKFDLSGD